MYVFVGLSIIDGHEIHSPIAAESLKRLYGLELFIYWPAIGLIKNHHENRIPLYIGDYMV